MLAIERIMAMDDAAWARHANPLSVLTRIPLLPLLALAAYSRAWIGPYCLIPLALLVLWTFLNPRVFPAPADVSSWASRGVLGERLYLARGETPIPAHHAVAARRLSALSALGLPFALYGVVALDPWATAAGVSVAFLGKLWFFDRMVWLYDELGRPRREA